MINPQNESTFALLYNVPKQHAFEVTQTDLRYMMQRLIGVALYTASATEEQFNTNPNFAIETIKKIVQSKSRRLNKYELQQHIDKGTFLLVRNVFN